MYGVYHGPDGLKKIAGRVHGLTRLFADAITEMGYHVAHEHYFDTLKIRVRFTREQLSEMLLNKHINVRYYNDEYIGISFDETHTMADVQELIDIFGGANHSHPVKVADKPAELAINWPDKLQRRSNFMIHPVFNTYQSEHEIGRAHV